jgi:hypothetical protein
MIHTEAVTLRGAIIAKRSHAEFCIAVLSSTLSANRSMHVVNICSKHYCVHQGLLCYN